MRTVGKDTTEINEIVRRNLVRTLFQPIVRLDDLAVVGFEALSRGPAGSALEMPDHLFVAADRAGVLGDLDAACIRSALAGAHSMLPAGALLFINVEPRTLTSSLIAETAPIAASGGLDIVLEVTERAITRSPGMLIDGVRSARERGWRIALDDVGVDPGSLALLPIIRPDVVKLDMALIRDQPDRVLGRTMSAVTAYAERTGATILAEGIETEAHLSRARSLGAEFGQGYRFGRPAPDVPDQIGPGSLVLRTGNQPSMVQASPFDTAISAGRTARPASKRLLLQISHHLEAQAAADAGQPLLLSAFQDVAHFTPHTRLRYGRLAATCSIVAALGVGMPTEPVPGVRGARLTQGDALEGEWSVIVLGPHYHGALLARDLLRTDADGDRLFDYVLTHDRELVERCAESVLRRVHPR